jgi:hypothetical protein
MNKMNVYCLKWGVKYNRKFVEDLKSALEKHLTVDYDFKCYTDTPETTYDIPVKYDFLTGVWHKIALLEFTGPSLYFDLDIKINDNINFLATDFKDFTVIDSRPWKKTPSKASFDFKFKLFNNTFINTSIMRWSNSSDICKYFLTNKEKFIEDYRATDRFIYNEKLSYKHFITDKISSWKEKKENTIVLYNGFYK